MHLRAFAFALGLGLLLACLSLAGVRVVSLEQNELEHVTAFRSLQSLAREPGSTRLSARIAEVDLHAGENALLELCGKPNLAAEAFQDKLQAVFWVPATQTLALKVPLDEAHLAVVKRSPEMACLTLGGGTIDAAGSYALDLVWGSETLSDAARSIPLRARILSRTPLGLREGLLVVLAALGAMVMVLAGFQRGTPVGDPPRYAPVVALAAIVVSVVLTMSILHLPIPGSIGGLVRGLSIAALEVIVAVTGARLLFPTVREGLRLYAPARREGSWLFAAVGIAALLNPLASWAVSTIPRTGEAPIEAFISWPSGALTFAALGMCVPLGEELFFRGFIYGALSRRGPVLAFVGTVVLFAAVHAQQAWGSWGALLSVTVTGIVLTSLRAATGSTLVPAVAHLLYNLSLWRDSFSG